MTRYAKRKLKYSLNENFNLLPPYVEWNRFVTLTGAQAEWGLRYPIHRHSNSGPPFFLIWSLPRLWYGSLSGSISLNHLSIFYNISCYNSLVLLTFVSRSSCRITYIYIKVWNNRQNTKRESSLRLDILQ
jgi:hypothetical protein